MQWWRYASAAGGWCTLQVKMHNQHRCRHWPILPSDYFPRRQQNVLLLMCSQPHHCNENSKLLLLCLQPKLVRGLHHDCIWGELTPLHLVECVHAAVSICLPVALFFCRCLSSVCLSVC